MQTFGMIPVGSFFYFADTEGDCGCRAFRKISAHGWEGPGRNEHSMAGVVDTNVFVYPWEPTYSI